MVQEGASHGENPQGSSDSNLNSVPATQGLKLDNCNYMKLNCAAVLLVNRACTPKALALAQIILVNPTNRRTWKASMHITAGGVAHSLHLIRLWRLQQKRGIGRESVPLSFREVMSEVNSGDCYDLCHMESEKSLSWIYALRESILHWLQQMSPG